MNRRSFFQSGIKEIFSHLWKSPAGQLVDRQLQALANLLAPQGLDYYISQSHPLKRSLDAAKDNSEIDLVKVNKSRNSPPNSTCFPRPPGSLATEKDFDEACTRCGDCRTACPYGAIQGDKDSGPFLDPNVIACHLCLDYPCIEACQEGALQPLSPNSLPSLGRAQLYPELCLNHKDPKSCELCQKNCPVPSAIKYDRKGLPEFTDYCTGCGLCRATCPTIPVAIEIATIEMSSESLKP